MNLINNVWNYLNGKKTTIGVVIHFVAYGLKGTNLINDTTFNTMKGAGDYIMAFGLVHKAVKQTL